MLQKKKPFAFKAEIQFTDLDISLTQTWALLACFYFTFSLKIVLLFFGVKQEFFFFLQNSLSQTQQDNLQPNPSCFNCQIVMSPSFRQQRCTTKLGSLIVPLHFSESLGKPFKKLWISDSLGKYLVFEIWKDKKENSKSIKEMLTGLLK